MIGLVAAAFLAAFPPGEREVPLFAARTDVIFVDVFVTRDGAPVTGLSAEDFEVRDDGEHRAVELVDLDTVPLEVLLAFDVSGSLAGERLDHLREAGRAFLRGLRPEDAAGLLTFSQEVRVRLAPTGDRAALEGALDGLTGGGMTALYDGLYAALTLGSGLGRKMSIVFSDGADTISWLGERQVLRTAEESNVLVQAVAVEPRSKGARTPASSLEALRRICAATGGRLWLASSSATLAGTFARVIEATRARYLLRFEPTEPLRPGSHKLQVRLRGKHGDVRARPSYFVPR